MSRPDWQTINAYVDGELSPAAAARVAAAVAGDRELAARVAMLSHLKAQTAACRREPDRTALPSSTGKRRQRAAAAAVAALAGLAALGVLLASWTPASAPPAWLQPARAVHARWVAQGIDDGPARGAPAARALQVLGTPGAPWVPDLRAINLRQQRAHRLDTGPAGAVHVGYTGPRSCMLSFVSWPDEHTLAGEPQRFGDGAEAAWAWRVGSVGYLLLATRMAPERLAVVVEVVHEATRKRLPPGPDAQRQYLASRRTTASCQT